MVRILFFGIISEKTGGKELSLTGNKTLSDLMKEVQRIYPDIKQSNFKIALNKCLVSDYDIYVQENDEIAFLPPFSGG